MHSVAQVAAIWKINLGNEESMTGTSPVTTIHVKTAQADIVVTGLVPVMQPYWYNEEHSTGLV